MLIHGQNHFRISDINQLNKNDDEKKYFIIN